MSGTVVDTSVWIDFFAGRGDKTFEDALAAGSVLVPPIVLSELVSGARSEKDRQGLDRVLANLPMVPTPRSHWLRVGELRRHLASRGIAISTPDAHVAQCALDLDALLLSRDRVFRRVEEHAALRLGGED